MQLLLCNLWREEDGQDLIEYALMGALVAGAIAGAVSGYTGGLGALMTSSFSQIAAAM